jgi:hypothetical protein
VSDVELCKDCGKPEGTFACKIRHIHMNTGDANSAREWREEQRKKSQVKKYGV